MFKLRYLWIFIILCVALTAVTAYMDIDAYIGSSDSIARTIMIASMLVVLMAGAIKYKI